MGTILFLILVVSVVSYLQYENYRKHALQIDPEDGGQEKQYKQTQVQEKRQQLMNFGAGLWKLLKR